MMLKEKCIYYNPSNRNYYLVLSVSDMIYGRTGDLTNPTILENWIQQDGTGLRFKIDNIIINSNYIRNYYLDDKCLDEFELVKELTDKEFYPIELLSYSRYNYPTTIIDVHKHMNSVSKIIKALRCKQSKKKKLVKDICDLERKLFTFMSK